MTRSSTTRLLVLAFPLGLLGCGARPLGPTAPSGTPTVHAPVEVRQTPERRTGLFVAGGIAIAGAATALGSTIAGELENQAIKDGGFGSGTEIADAADRGDTFNQIAFVSGALAIGAIGAAIGLYVYGSPSERPARATTTTAGRGGRSRPASLPRLGFEF